MTLQNEINSLTYFCNISTFKDFYNICTFEKIALLKEKRIKWHCILDSADHFIYNPLIGYNLIYHKSNIQLHLF